MASARLVGLFILLLYSKDSYGQQNLEFQHLGLHVVGSPNVASCLSKNQASNTLQNGQNHLQQSKVQQYNLQQQQQQAPQQQQGFQQPQAYQQQQQGFQQQQAYQQQQQGFQQQQAYQQQQIWQQQQQYIQEQQALQQQMFQQQAMQQSMNAQPNNFQTPAKQQCSTVQQSVNSQNYNIPSSTNPSFNLQFVKPQKPEVFDCNSPSLTKSQPQGSQNIKETSSIPEIELTSLKFIPLDPNFSLQGNPEASLTFQIGSQVHEIPLAALTQPTSSPNQNFQNQPLHTSQISPQIQSMVQQQVDNKYVPQQNMPFTSTQSAATGQVQNPPLVALGSNSPILSTHKNQPTITWQNILTPLYQDLIESLSVKYPPFINFLQNPQIQSSIPSLSSPNPVSNLQQSLNPVPNLQQSSTSSMSNKPIAIFPVKQIPTIQPPQPNQLFILPMNTQVISAPNQPLMTFSPMVPQPTLQAPQNQAMITSLQPKPQSQPVISSNSIQPIYQSQSIPSVSSFNNQPILAPAQNPYLSVQVQVPPAQNFPTIMSMQSPSFLGALDNQQPWLNSPESGYSLTQNIPIVNPQSQPVFPFILPEYQTAFVANSGFSGKPKSSSLRSLLPILINILKENTNCGCPYCNGLYDDSETNLFGECSNQRKSLPKEASVFSTFTGDHQELSRSSRSEQNETETDDSIKDDESAEENEDSSEYVDDNDDE